MIKKSLALLSISAAFFAHAQDITVIKNSADVYSNQSLPGSAKYNAMAGSMGALGGDASVLNSNPAGLGVYIAGDISGTLAVKSNQNTSTLGSSSVSYKTNDTNLSHAAGVAVFEINGTTPWKFVNVGVNYSSQSLEDYTETGSNNKITYQLDDGDYVKFDGHAYDRTGDVSKMSVGVGGNYDNRIYVGAGLNFHGSSLNQTDTARLIYNSDNTYESFSKQYTPYYEQGTGFSANVGIIGKINNQFRLGAAIETPTWWTIDRAYQYYDKANSSNDGEYTETEKFSSPMKATLSAAFVPNKNFALNADYTIGLTKPKFSTEDADLQNELNGFYSDNYKSVSEVKIGAEYRIQQLRLRGGYAFTTSPFSDMKISAVSDAGTTASLNSDMFVGKKNTLGAGIGYDFKSFYIDAAYQNVSSDYTNAFLKGSSTAGTEYYSASTYIASDTPVATQVKNQQNNFYFTLGWKF